MAPDNTTPATPAASTAAPVTQPTAPDVSAPPTAAPDLSGLVSSGSQPQPTMATAVQGSMAPYIANEQAAYQKAAAIANTPTPAPPAGPHAKLMGIIQGIAVGMGAAGRSLATHGKEGGVDDVLAYEKQKQEMAQSAQQAVQAQKNQQIQNQLMIGSTNHTLAANIMMLGTLPTDLQLKDLQVSKEQQAIASGKISMAQASAEFQNQYGISPAAYNNMMAPASSGTAVDPKDVQSLRDFSTQKFKAAAAILPVDDPTLKTAQQVLADPKSSPLAIMGAVSAVNRQLGLNAQVTAAKEKQEQQAAGARPKDLNDAVGRMTQAQLAFKAYPSPANKQAVDDATAARDNFLDADASKKRTEQLIADGDPNVLAPGLVHGDISWNQVTSSRKPEFITAALKAANALSLAETGKPFSAVVNAANYEQATNAQVQNKLKMVESITRKGGEIDIARDALSKLPQMDEKTANKFFNIVNGEFGDSAISNAQTALLGLADSYSQIMGEGGGSDSSRQQAMDLLHTYYSKGQMAGAIDVMRKDVIARHDSLVGNNPALKQLFPPVEGSAQKSVRPAGTTGIAPGNDGKLYYHDISGKILGPATETLPQ